MSSTISHNFSYEKMPDKSRIIEMRRHIVNASVTKAENDIYYKHAIAVPDDVVRQPINEQASNSTQLTEASYEVPSDKPDKHLVEQTIGQTSITGPQELQDSAEINLSDDSVNRADEARRMILSEHGGKND